MNKMNDKKILLSHGSGGRLTHELIKGLFLKKLNNPILSELSDSALLGYKERLAFTTDSFVVTPLFFPGGDIGKLSVCGTVNDLVMQGGSPEYLSVAMIVEEGLPYSILERITGSISAEAKKSGVFVVTGDFKVVEKGAADRIFINTSGIGRVMKGVRLSVKNIRPGDKIIVTGNIGQHGLAILAGRQNLGLGFSARSDCAALNSLLLPLLDRVQGIRFMRDPTRGGLATTLNEITESSGIGIIIEEKNIPILNKTRAACELLGVDPLYLASEGRAVIVADKNCVKDALALLRRHALGKDARVIGSASKKFPSQVVMRTVLGTERLLDMLTSEVLPRIC
jgi:hydrogenase expression/formation protein HypE